MRLVLRGRMRTIITIHCNTCRFRYLWTYYDEFAILVSSLYWVINEFLYRSLVLAIAVILRTVFLFWVSSIVWGFYFIPFPAESRFSSVRILITVRGWVLLISSVASVVVGGQAIWSRPKLIKKSLSTCNLLIVFRTN